LIRHQKVRNARDLAWWFRVVGTSSSLLQSFFFAWQTKENKRLTMSLTTATTRRMVRTLAHRVQIDWYVFLD
jgi:hypothetical protein